MAQEAILPSYIHKGPALISIVGQTSSGKSSLAYGLIRHIDKIFDKEVKGVVVCYRHFQELYNKMKELSPVQVTLHMGIPTNDQITEYTSTFNGHWVLFCDDLSASVTNEKSMFDSYVMRSHHDNFSIINLTQNFYTQGKYARTMQLQVHYVYLLKTRRDRRQISILGSQMFPGRGRAFLECFEDATNIHQPTLDAVRLPGYLLVSLHPHEEARMILTTSLLPPGGVRIMYTI